MDEVTAIVVWDYHSVTGELNLDTITLALDLANQYLLQQACRTVYSSSPIRTLLRYLERVSSFATLCGQNTDGGTSILNFLRSNCFQEPTFSLRLLCGSSESDKLKFHSFGLRFVQKRKRKEKKLRLFYRL